MNEKLLSCRWCHCVCHFSPPPSPEFSSSVKHFDLDEPAPAESATVHIKCELFIETWNDFKSRKFDEPVFICLLVKYAID